MSVVHWLGKFMPSQMMPRDQFDAIPGAAQRALSRHGYITIKPGVVLLTLDGLKIVTYKEVSG